MRLRPGLAQRLGLLQHQLHRRILLIRRVLVLAKGKALAPQAKRAAITAMVDQFHLSERRACRLVGLARDSYRHPPQETEMNQALSAKIIGCRSRYQSARTRG